MADPPDGRRAQAAFRVRYRSLDELALALSRDLAHEGLLMRTARHLPIDAIVRVYLELPDDGGTLSLVGRVTSHSVDRDSTAVGKPVSVAVRLLDFAEHRPAIERFIAARRAGAPAVAPAPAASARRALDVVIVDDDAGFRDSIAAILRQRGDQVRETGDGLEALSACLSQPPDLLLSDVQMPRMDGWQLLRLLRARSSLVQVPIVLLTTLTSDEARLEGYRLGVDDYIGKPVDGGELLARVDRIVARAQQLSPNRQGLRGDLEHVALVSLLSFLAVEQKSGALTISGDSNARIYLRGGHLYHVDIDGRAVTDANDPALQELLEWRRGRFEFAAQEVACADELHVTVTALLREQQRRSDGTPH